MENEMSERKRVDRVELGPMNRGKAVDIYASEFVCTAAGKVSGDLDCETAEVKGACKVEGDVRATILKVSGSMKVEGDITSELIRVKGALKVEGGVSATNLRTSGATKVEGTITSGEEIFVQGVLRCDGNIEAQRFILLGVTDVEGTLKAQEFTAELAGKSSIRDLDCTTISVKRGKSASNAELVCRAIRGETIHLENTVAELVEGRSVVIGQNCTISAVKADSLEVHASSRVGKRL